MTEPWAKTKAAMMLAGEASIAGTAAAAELQYPGAGVFIATAVPLVTSAMDKALATIFRTATSGGLTLAEITARLADLEAGIRLMNIALESARVAPHDERMRIVGHAMAIGARDQALIDQELVIVAAAATLEPHHFRLLRAGEEIAARNEGEGAGRWATGQVQDVDSGLPPAMADILVGGLLGVGAVIVPGLFLEAKVYENTELGRRLVERAKAATGAVPEH